MVCRERRRATARIIAVRIVRRAKSRSIFRRVVLTLGPRMVRPSTGRLWASAPKGARAGCPRLTRATGRRVEAARVPKPRSAG